MSRGFASNYRLVLLATGLFAAFGGLGVRLVWLHVVNREELLQTIAKTRRQLIVEKARRGDILDAGGAILATSRPFIVVAVDPWALRSEDEPKYGKLAAILKMPEAQLRAIFATKYHRASPVKPTAAVASSSANGLALNLDFLQTAKSAAGEAASAVSVATEDDAASGAAPVVAPVTNVDDDRDLDNPDETGLRKRRWAKLAEVTESAYLEIEKLGVRGLCPPERTYRRLYPHNELASHVVGYVNQEEAAIAGVERYADFYLAGKNGWSLGERDGRGRPLAQFNTRSVRAVDGYNVRLSINQTVQDLIEQELEVIGKTYQPLKATIIVSDPRDGFILGMANYPTFDPNAYNRVPKDEMARMKNVAVADVYEPGSVFKIVAASGALEENLVTRDTTFDCTSERITYKGRELKLPGEDHHFDHPLTVAEIISHSSNRGAAQLAMQLGDERFDRYARAFGFGHTLGFPIGGEVGGIFAPHEKWNPIDITRIPMGQSIAATVLQMHQAMSVIAADGVLLRPQIIRKITDASGETVYRYDRTEISRVVSERTARTMARLLEGVAQPGGTAAGAAIKINGIDYEVAGKTGTAQKYIKELQPNGNMKLVPSRKNHVASFVGFFPATRPQVVISVIVDDADAHAPGGVAYGATVAVPVFKRIGEQLIPILDIKPPFSSARLDLVVATEGGRR